MMTAQSIVRPFHLDDTDAYYAVASDPATPIVHSGRPALEIGAAREWARQQPAGQHRLVVEQDGAAVAFGILQQIQRPRRVHSGTLEWLIHPAHRESEIGEQLLTALIDLADHWLNLRRVEVQLITGDDTGLRLVEPLGFEHEGINRMGIFGSGRFQDIHVLSRLRDYAPSQIAEIARPVRTRQRPAQQRPVAVSIRPIRPEDATDLHALFRHPAVARMLNQLPSQEYNVVAERTAQHMQGLYRLVAEADGRVVGDINFFIAENPRLSHSAGFGISVHPDYWGRGVGGRLMEAMLDLADNWLNLRRVWLEVYTDNLPAVYLYEKYGFEIEGTRRLYSYGDGRWADAYFMARLRPF
jgi:putative acetyltransferase